MFDSESETRYYALQMALDMTFLTEEGVISTLTLPEVLNAAAAFELFMLHGEASVPHSWKVKK